jgi:hypothetical protein
VTDRTLDSGLRLIVQERPATETVALRLMLLGGALDAPLERRSLAEIHASLLARSTWTHKAAELARTVEALGGRMSSGTSLRAETVSFDGPAESLEPGIRLLAEVLREPRLDPYELEKEKGLLVSSIASANDSPSSYLIDETYKALFTGHPFERLVQPQPEEVRAVTIDEVRRFHEGRLANGRIALIVVGKCAAADVEGMARAAFGPSLAALRSGVAPRPAAGGVDPEELREIAGAGTAAASPAPLPTIPAPAPLPADARRRVGKRTTQAEIMVALSVAGRLRRRPARLRAASPRPRGVSRRGSTRRSARSAASRTGSLCAASRCPRPAGSASTRGRTRRTSPRSKRSSAPSCVASRPSRSPRRSSTRARRYLITSVARDEETNGGRAGSLVVALLDGRPFRSYQQNVARLDAVTPERVQKVARRILEGRHVAIVTLPVAGDRRFPPAHSLLSLPLCVPGFSRSGAGRLARRKLCSHMFETIAWTDAGVVMLDQRRLPGEEIYNTYARPEEVADAIRTMVIRGAPAIGVAAAMGLALGAKKLAQDRRAGGAAVGLTSSGSSRSCATSSPRRARPPSISSGRSTG